MWTAIFYQDTEVPGVGTIVAIAPDGQTVFKERVDSNDPQSVLRFAETAKAAFVAQADKQTAEQTIAAAAAAELNKAA
jgi:hypothetical protein